MEYVFVYVVIDYFVLFWCEYLLFQVEIGFVGLVVVVFGVEIGLELVDDYFYLEVEVGWLGVFVGSVLFLEQWFVWGCWYWIVVLLQLVVKVQEQCVGW